MFEANVYVFVLKRREKKEKNGLQDSDQFLLNSIYIKKPPVTINIHPFIYIYSLIVDSMTLTKLHSKYNS